MVGLLGVALCFPPIPLVSWSTPVPGGVPMTACARVSGGALGGSMASAVCVGQQGGFAYLLTAAHVVPKGEPRLYEFFDAPGDKAARSYTQGDVVVREVDADVALVRLAVGVGTIPAVRLAKPGQRPKQFPRSVLVVGCPNGVPPRATLDTLQAKTLVRRTETGGLAFFWETEIPPVGGMSGGPVFSAAGEVIGVCAAVQDRRGYYTHHDEILYALKQQGFSWLFE